MKRKKVQAITLHSDIANPQVNYYFSIFSFLEDYLIHYKTNTYGGLPFLEDERMFSSAYLLCKENAEITDEHLFRLGQVDGKTRWATIYL